MKNSRNLRPVCASLLFASGLLLSACGGGGESSSATPTLYDVTFMNQETVLKTEQVEHGKKATDWTPVVEGYSFEGWYGTPNFTHAFDFDTPITADTSIFGKFVSEVSTPDTRDFYIVGSGTGPILMESNWGKVCNDTMKMTKAVDKNEYTYTIDLYPGDEFQFAINTSWENQRGVGYMKEFNIGEEEAFQNPGSAYGNDARRSNIKVKKSGNYTFTLKTHPDTDFYDTENPNYTEAGRENFNLNDYDTISWVRNGDAAEITKAITAYYIKGSGVTKWADVYNAHTKLVEAEGKHTLSIYLRQNEEFLFTSTVTVGDKVTTGTEYVRASNLDEASKALFTNTASYNLVAKADGNYTFAYDEASKVLSATFKAGAMVEADYYLDGTFGEGSWSGYTFNEDYKLIREGETDVYTIENVNLPAEKEFIIQSYKAGSTETGKWGEESWNGLGSYNYTYLVGGGEKFGPVSDTNKNIKILEAGAYDISFDRYAKQISIKEHVEGIPTYDVFIKGTMNSWKFDFKDEWKFTQNPAKAAEYEITLAIGKGDEFGIVVYDEGSQEGYGTWVGKDKVGTSGTLNDKFDLTKNNITCKEAGTYRIVYDNAAVTLDFYAPAA